MNPVPMALALAGVLGTIFAGDAQAQVVVGPRWGRSGTGRLGMPPASIGAHEIERMEQYLVFGVPYCAGLAAREYAANQAVARNMATYLASVSTTATDPQARVAALRVAAAFSAFPCAYPGRQLPVIAPPAPQP